jgi:hypothetical protein
MMRMSNHASPSRVRVAAALAVVSLVITGCGGAEEPVEVVPVAADVTVTDVAPEPNLLVVQDVDEAAALAPVVTYEVVLSRDPFDPVRQPPPAEPVTASTTEGEPTAPGIPGGVPLVPVDGTPTSPACTTYGDVICDGISVALIDVKTADDVSLAVVRVDTEELELAEGTTFGQFRLLTIDGSCASFVYGDESFSLCEGDEILK